MERDRTKQILQYLQQLLLSEGFGVLVQCKLLPSLVLVVWTGSIGPTLLLLLAAIGMGLITVVTTTTWKCPTSTSRSYTPIGGGEGARLSLHVTL